MVSLPWPLPFECCFLRGRDNRSRQKKEYKKKGHCDPLHFSVVTSPPFYVKFMTNEQNLRTTLPLELTHFLVM